MDKKSSPGLVKKKHSAHAQRLIILFNCRKYASHVISGESKNICPAETRYHRPCYSPFTYQKKQKNKLQEWFFIKNWTVCCLQKQCLPPTWIIEILAVNLQRQRINFKHEWNSLIEKGNKQTFSRINQLLEKWEIRNCLLSMHQSMWIWH